MEVERLVWLESLEHEQEQESRADIRIPGEEEAGGPEGGQERGAVID